MNTDQVSARVEVDDLDRSLKSATRQMWALGDYHRFALATIWQLGPVLVRACGIGRGQRVLDVAAGSGNTAIRAAEAGAQVIASDLTPENFAAGRREAASRGVNLEWREADAEALPFGDDEFDVVTSTFGAIFAPNHQTVAEEMLRVCRPGGTIGLLAFRPEGVAGEFFELLSRYAPPPAPGASSPLLWGNEEHVRDLLGAGTDLLEMTPGEYIERSPAGPGAYRAMFESTFGPLIAIRSSIAEDGERAAAFDRELADFVTRGNRGAPGGPAEYPYPYLLIVARKA